MQSPREGELMLEKQHFYFGLVLMALGGCSNQTNQPAKDEATTASVETQRLTDANDTANAELSKCYEKHDADCAKEEAALDAAQSKLDKQIDMEFAETDKEIDKIAARADCIKKELGTKFDDASSPEITAARKKCGIDDPADVEEQLREQRERLSR
jgi:hypothetical protein